MERLQRAQMTNQSSLAQVKSLAQADRFDEALEICAALLELGTEDPNEVRRARAHVFALAGDYSKASEDRETVLRSDTASLRDFYYSADAALKAREIDLAATRFLQTLERGKKKATRGSSRRLCSTSPFSKWNAGISMRRLHMWPR